MGSFPAEGLEEGPYTPVAPFNTPRRKTELEQLMVLTQNKLPESLGTLP